MHEIQSLFSLKGKTALVCGASQGIGRATAESFAELGATVLLVSRTRESLEEVQKALKGSGHESFPCDLGKPAELDRLIQHLKNRRVEILVNNSGGPKAGPLAAAEGEEFTQAFQQHILAAQKITQTLLPGMKAAGYGRIINVISTSVKTPLANLGVSNTIRGAMASWSKTMANELGAFGITVNNVLPGYTKTSRLGQLLKGNAERLAKPEAELEKDWLKTIPAGRFGESWETAAAMSFLASPLASYINGVNLPVDGGRTPSL